jgi:hypothetical protein
MPTPPADRRLPRLPEPLEPVYRLFASRYSRAHLDLSTYPGRWLAFRAAEAMRPTALALADEEGGSAEGFVRFRREALAAAAGDEVVLVKIARHALRPGKAERPAGGDAQAGAAERADVDVLSIVVESSAHRIGLIGGVVLDARGRPARVHEPLPLLLE